VPGAKERALLAVLIARAGQPVSADELIEALWPDDPPPSATKSLQAHVVRLRSALEPERPKGSAGQYVVRRAAGYALSLEGVQVDALEFAERVLRGAPRSTGLVRATRHVLVLRTPGG
jgi:DNA-binding SARP family transcriptional activator